ncbi:nicotinate-nucleotide--dimethylbenzimidazole phosphoribosyltransferase [Kineothrix sp. MB12-C1]|uniref:nicotinate-nucleotide--dimethylbenzimidazole phosphoribosyltransferase n=1 Tax=Kineothrix sp. MB12-C1 TaxID=3070215 RepID=UPI0027D2693D|nr:nicotinate-nucleotide--dimethylbenzimidazole phosphoribosyltransferase [Kineothrix sp. MB12-C1]WMC93311.1 nicotinate-nucleotide--dimethylbenzimidazole phosphoribosyltransferase [Kineothrix sp. MB12-C1]
MTEKEWQSLYIHKPDDTIRQMIKERWDNIAKPLDGLGQFEEITARIGAILKSEDIDISKKAVIVMCADNGIVEEGISQSGQEVTSSVAISMAEGTSSICRMAKIAGTDVIPVDIGINREMSIEGILPRKVAYGTRNFLKAPAMTREEALQAMEIGLKLVQECKEKGYRILATGEMGIGNTTTSAAVSSALLGCSVRETVGKGAGLSEEGLRHKTKVIEQALKTHQLSQEDSLGILAAVGGLDIAGLVGVFIGGALFHIPIVVDGVISAVAALTAQRMLPGVKEFLIPSHMSREPAAKKVMEELGLYPVITADMALGEGSGAVMMFSLLDIALSVYKGHTGFQDIGVRAYRRFL